jgi:hypothetical protein
LYKFLHGGKVEKDANNEYYVNKSFSDQNDVVNIRPRAYDFMGNPKRTRGERGDNSTSTFWNNQKQPYQNVYKQYHHYIADGYNDNFTDSALTKNKHNENNLGVWITCFVAFLNNDERVTDFLNLWYLQTLKYTTQDQLGFTYVCYKTGLVPYTLPDDEISGESPHKQTDFYIKHNHGK